MEEEDNAREGGRGDLGKERDTYDIFIILINVELSQGWGEQCLDSL